MICKICGYERGPLMCPKCWRDYFMYNRNNPKPVCDWDNSPEFKAKLDKEWEEELKRYKL